MSDPRSSSGGGWRLWIAQGFGIGRIPFAPGTFGSLLGLAWTAALLGSGSRGVYLIGCVAGFATSVWLCGAGERLLGRRDPGSVVLDEIAALPVCFAPWAFSHGVPGSELGTVSQWMHQWQGGLPVAGFLFFRLFDIWKPWPVRQSQDLPGGWGVTVDDFLAAGYSAAALALLGRVINSG